MKGVSFDLEGTCIDVETLHFTAYQATLREYNIELTLDQITDIPGVMGGGSRYVIVAMERRYPNISFTKFSIRKKYHYEHAFYHASLSPRKGLLEVLEKLLELRIPVALGSRTLRDHGVHMLTASGLNKYFTQENSVFFEDVTNEKPAPDVYIKTATLMHISTDDQLIFEDSIIGVQAGVRAGSSIVAIPTKLGYNETYRAALLAAGASRCIDEWTKVMDILLELL